MSAAATTWAWKQDVEDPYAKLILVRLADRAGPDDDGTFADAGDFVCWPSIASLVRDTAASESTVQRKIRDLVKAGLLRKLPRSRKNGASSSNVYVLVGCGPRDTPVPVPQTPATTSEPSDEREPLAAAPRVTKQNIVWDALVEVCGAPTTRSERGDFGKTVSELRAVIPEGATLEDVQQAMGGRRTRWVQRFPDAVFTHRVLRTHWSDLGYGLRAELEPRRLTADDDLEDDGTGRRTF